MSWHLALTVDRTARLPLAAQIRGSLRKLIEDGTLRPGSRIPSSRQLASDLGVARSVVVEAYEQLAAEGYLVTRRGSGTRVAQGTQPSPGPASSLLPAPVDVPAGTWDLRTGTSDTAAFPRQDWIRSVTAVLADAGRAELGYSPPSGVPLARHVLVGYLGRVRGVRTRPESLMITAGFAQGLAMLCKVLRERGHDALAVEDPGHPGEWEFIAGAGLRPVGIPVDEDGMRVDLLPESGARAVLTTPGNQFPTGVRLSPERRERLVAWARAVDGYVVEDDFDSAYLNRADRVPALQSLAPDRVVYAGSASKVLAPALRLGWLAAPSELMASIEYARVGWDIGCSGIEQLAFAHFISTGAYERHQRRLRTEFGRRRETVRAEVPVHLPGAEVLGGDSGLQAYVRLPPGTDEDALVRSARGRSVLVRGGTFYTLTDDTLAPRTRPPAIVLSYAGTPPDSLRAALSTLGACYREEQGG
ncbi:PLP-dependent aminotransferase family protein [Streptomyces sp. MUM 203J]|uniref:MocR-like pyridoxine biosynthesis transcription factor PdxR n=1 Tax=Streptomyces sp. MUM 203J TaxID=2791990 RepID=UPI001F03689A|nr:PLP-dependent aminotransferase family protein [Streptomyces sp. MUM 203J]MCH0540398.1 PLP-dependent aminotransferase family protein [Streptomyces sp. MUM 203J]